MNFNDFKKAIETNFKTLSKDHKFLFQVQLDNDEFYEHYLTSFPEGTNPVFKERREYDCSACRSFIKNLGKTVFVKDNKLISIWDVDTGNENFNIVAKAMDSYIRSKTITNIYLSSEKKIGVDKNFDSDLGVFWEHFYVELPEKYLNKTSKSIGDIQGNFRTNKQVMKRSFDEITIDSLNVTLELISTNSLHRGNDWEKTLKAFLQLKKDYDKITKDKEKNNFCWIQSALGGPVISKLRNHSIGTFLVDISTGRPLDEAVNAYERMVGGENYKRSKPIFTERMKEAAKSTINKLGYSNSLGRRYATLDDIEAKNVLFSNRDSAKVIKGDPFDGLDKFVKTNPKRFSRAEEISADKFINDVLPTADEVEVLLENKLSPNMVSLISAVDKDAPSMFKWNNAFSYAYSGNMAESAIKDRVKSAGGDVEGVLRFSIQWNDLGMHNQDDLDAHCVEPDGNRIFFSRPVNRMTTGKLDVDIVYPESGVPAVENITWTDRSKMRDGVYKFMVKNFSNRGGQDGFKAEIEFDGTIYSFEYRKPIRNKQFIDVAEVTFKDGEFTIKESLESSMSSRELWGLNTNQFIPVSTIMLSPNYWDGEVGNKHYFFMLKDCKNTESPNGFYNEFLKQELNPHRKVFEALGSIMKVSESENQLSGVGFSSTKRAEVVVKVKGSTERVMKVKI